jgi:EAL domain-containing protein (putative c-di-GMP-specific phosphodiesterase class I)
VKGQRTRLAELGYDAYQGYLFSRPVPAQDFVLLL